MDIKVTASRATGKVQILSSKSELHRLLILSAFADTTTKIKYSGTSSKDVLATVGSITALGAKVDSAEGMFTVTPITKHKGEVAEVFCNESGSTLRFILPVFSAFGNPFNVTVSGRLGERPLSPMYEILQNSGVNLTENGKYPLRVSGKFTGGNVSIRGDVSSQFISGLLMAMPLTEKGGTVTVTGDFQSRPYVDITIGAMRKFGVRVTENDGTFTVSGRYKSPSVVTAGGDWSNTAFFASMGAINGEISISGLERNSYQGDRAVKEILSRFGANVDMQDETLSVSSARLTATEIDAKDIPDLVPTLAVVASLSNGVTKIYNAQRLRIKESDRIKSVMEMINNLGGDAKETEDGLLITGKEWLSGGTVDAYNDHRIVMSACVGALKSKNPVIIKGAQAVEKSYPQFFEVIKTLGFKVEVQDVLDNR